MSDKDTTYEMSDQDTIYDVTLVKMDTAAFTPMPGYSYGLPIVGQRYMLHFTGTFEDAKYQHTSIVQEVELFDGYITFKTLYSTYKLNILNVRN